MNPLFNKFGGPQQAPSQNLFQQFSEFASNFRGDPKQRVNELLRSGQMTQQQFQQYSQMANQLSSMFRRR